MWKAQSGFSLRPKLIVWGVLLGAALLVRAERLPIRTYSTADGLPHNVVNRIVREVVR